MSKNVDEYKQQVLEAILHTIENRNEVLAAWEGGSAATGHKDQFSDIDLCIVADAPIQSVIELVQDCLQKFQVIHTWQTAKSVWGEGIAQRILILKDAPKYFFVDVGVFDSSYSNLINSFLEIERHGQPRILFDKANIIVPKNTDPEVLFKKQQVRANELKQGFVIFKTLVHKELERGNSIDAIWFYQNGLVRPLVEIMGMRYRPFKYDFGMRYIHRTFPLNDQKLIEQLNYVIDTNDLKNKLDLVEKSFNINVNLVLDRKSI